MPTGPFTSPALAPDLECGLFWDYENISLPKGIPGAHASNRLREVCLRFGRLVERRVYHDPEKVNSVQLGHRSALDMAGFTLVDCPARNFKETIDKKIIVDVMHFALTRVARHQPACVVLLTNDGDYAYMLSRLRDLQVHAVVIYTSGHAASALLTSCDCALTWQGDVLQSSALPPTELGAEGGEQAASYSSASSSARLLSTCRAAARRSQPWGAFRLKQSLFKRTRQQPRDARRASRARLALDLDALVDSGCGMDGAPHPEAARIERAQAKARQQAAKKKEAAAAARPQDPESEGGGGEAGWGDEDEDDEEEEGMRAMGRKTTARAKSKRKGAPAAYGTAPYVRGGPGRKPCGVAKRPGKGKVAKGGGKQKHGSSKNMSRKGSKNKKGRR